MARRGIREEVEGPTLFGWLDEEIRERRIADQERREGQRRGRPMLSLDELHNCESTVRFRRDEFATVFRAARGSGEMLARWVRDAAVEKARRG